MTKKEELLKRLSGIVEGKDQPCDNYDPKDEEYKMRYAVTPFRHQCPICYGFRGLCANCHWYHHENSWKLCVLLGLIFSLLEEALPEAKLRVDDDGNLVPDHLIYMGWNDCREQTLKNFKSLLDHD